MTKRLLPHVALLWLTLASLTWVVGVDRAVYDADEGALLMQVQQIAEHGTWWAADPGADIDPDGQFLGIAHARVRPGEVLPFPARPGMVWISTVAWDLGGVRAVTLLGLTSLTLAAWAVARVAGMIDPRAAVPAFWVTGLATPLTFQALTLQGHGHALGFAAVALTAVLLGRDSSAKRVALLGMVAAFSMLPAALIRRETLLFGIAIAVAGVMSWVETRNRKLLLVCLPPAGGAVVGVLLDRHLMTNVLELGGRSLPVSSNRSGFLVDRIFSTARFVLPGHFPDSELAMLLSLGAALVALVAVVLYLRHGSDRDLVGGLMVAAALLVVRLVVAPTPMIPGLIPAFPLALPAIVLGARYVGRNPIGRFLIATFASSVALTALTQYPFGGGFEWGSRYLSFAILALIPVGTTGAVQLLGRVDDATMRRTLIGALAIVAVVPATMGVIAQRHARVTNADNLEAGYELAAALGTDIVVSTHAETPRVNTGYLTDGVPWFHAWAQELDELLALLEARGYTEVPLFTRDLEETLEHLDGTGWALRGVTLRPDNPGTVALGVLTRST